MKYATCAHCGAAFSYTNKGKPRRFCSHECYSASLIGTDRGGMVTAICETCGDPFTVKRFYFARKDGKALQRFCSRTCASPTISAAHQKHTERPCLTCGEPFKPRTNKGRLSEFCSKRCAGDSGRAPKALIAKQEAGEPTWIERAMREALDRVGIAYVFQFPIYSSIGLKRYVCDFAIPAARLIVECDGDYWHSKPRAKASDKRKDTYLKKHGYTVLRFSESEIKRDVAACVQSVLSYL